MNIRLGSNEYALVPGSTLQELGDNLEIQFLADELDIGEIEDVLKDSENTAEMITVDDEGVTQQVVRGYTNLHSMQKKYHVLYSTEYPEQPEWDPESEEPPEYLDPILHYADIIYVKMSKPGIEAQVETNTANIEFIAIMSDIEL